MKKVLASALLVGCFAGAAYAGLPAGTGVNGSLHDMNFYINTHQAGPAYSDAMGRVCVYCHTPHAAVKPSDASFYPLWNHAGTDAAVSYTPYTWATPLNAGDGGTNDFTIVGNQAIMGPSRLCLSCHDGTIAVDQHNGSMYGNKAETGSFAFSGAVDTTNGRAKIGTDLSDDHPIGFDYNAIQAYRDAHSGYAGNGSVGKEIALSTSTFATSVTPQADLAANQGKYNTVARAAAGSRRIVDVLYQGQYMTCATCHEVHNKDNAIQDNFIATPGANQDTAKAPNYFLYAKEKDSLICLSCHVK
jgi:cytochrome c553